MEAKKHIGLYGQPNEETVSSQTVPLGQFKIHNN